MKIEDLSFITEIDQENTNDVNGGMDDPFAGVGNNLFAEQNANWLDFIGDPVGADIIRSSIDFTIEPTDFGFG
jgi:hypothetical protein